MRVLRGLLGALLWIAAALVGLVGCILCVTVLLLPLGIPLVMLARRLFTRSVRLMLPRKVSHPVDEMGKKARKRGRGLRKSASGLESDVAKKGRKARKAARRQRKRIG
jgi:hypothetical protein